MELEQCLAHNKYYINVLHLLIIIIIILIVIRKHKAY